ncbi:MAG: VWA domain-containing protein [bacterium]|nr:VWA domain-containing protein [bacterium]
MRNLSRFAPFALLALGCLLPASASENVPTVKDSGVTERVTVELVEIKVRVADGKGRPVTDLSQDEVRVFQGGREQRMAYFEPLSRRGLEAPVTPVPLYDGRGQAQELPATEAVLPPKPVRRIVLAFDPRNSRMPVRENWRRAALDWVRASMQPQDLVAVVVLRGAYADWATELTADAARIRLALETIDLFTDVPNRNRRDEMTTFLNDLRTLCQDNTGGRNAGGSARGSSRVNDLSATNETTCAFDLARPMVHEWSAQSNESFEGLRGLAGQLSAVPGQKSVILFSEGIIDDAASVAVHAMASVFGLQAIDLVSMTSRLQRLDLLNLGLLYHITASSNVAFFTLDTRHANEGSDFSNLENNAAPNAGFGMNPYKEMYEASRAGTAGLAYSTGGRPFYGGDNLSWKIRTAADAYFGIYSLGYYRSEKTDAGARLKVKIKRKKLVLNYEKKSERRVHEPRTTALELAIGRPESAGRGDMQRLPVALITKLDQLPLRKGGGGFGCELGVFLQAVRPDGTVAGEHFETIAVVVDKKQRESAEQHDFRHVVHLELEPGPMRLRARVSDDRQEVLGDRAIDLTLSPGHVSAGL